MPTTTAATPDPTPVRSPLLSWLGVVAVTLGIFAVVTTEILPIGLLTSIGADFTVSEGTAGLMMTMPGLLAAVSAPLVTAATGRIDRRLTLAAFVLLLALANFLAAAATDYRLMLVSRVLVGITIGGFWSIGAGLARRLVPAGSAGRATAVIFSAVPLGSVLGVPLATHLGGVAGWRTAFTALGLLSLAVFALLLAVIPPLPPGRPTRLKVLGGLPRRVDVRFALLTTFLVVFAHFATYTYVTPFLERVPRMDPGLITLCLLVYGAAGVVGNFLGGSAVTRHSHGTFAVVAALLAVSTLLLPVLGRDDAGALALLVVWGAAYGAVPVCSQTWFARAAPDAPEAATVLFTASFQAALSLGALTGGLVTDRFSPSAVLILGGVTAALTVPAVLAHRSRGPFPPGAEHTRSAGPPRVIQM